MTLSRTSAGSGALIIDAPRPRSPQSNDPVFQERGGYDGREKKAADSGHGFFLNPAWVIAGAAKDRLDRFFARTRVFLPARRIVEID